LILQYFFLRIILNEMKDHFVIIHIYQYYYNQSIRILKYFINQLVYYIYHLEFQNFNSVFKLIYFIQI